MNCSETSQNISKEDIDKEILQFTLALYNNPQLSRKAVDDVIQIFQTFISKMFIPFIQKNVETYVKPISSEMCYAKAQFVLEDAKDIFKAFSTEHLRLKKYEEKSFYIPPKLFEIGQESTYITDEDQKARVVKKSIHAAHVPLIDTLKSVLSEPGALDTIVKYIHDLRTEEKFLSNAVQGELWKKKYSDLSKIIIPLYLYFDEFETRNPLGSHAGEEKLGGVYVSIASLPPHISAKLKNVFLSTIFHSKHLKTFGNEVVFRETIEELNILSQKGITMHFNGSDQQIYFQCIQILGDNLGQNMICGFSESFRAHRFCRICTATSVQSQEMVEENAFLLRDVQAYEKDIALKNFGNSGLKEECIFNQIKNFHICENISVDVMHDLQEGVALYTISKVLQGIISEEKITLKTVNNRIQSFYYSELENSNKPRPLFYSQGKKGGEKLKIKQSASEMLCLVRYLGLMIGDLVSGNSRYWKLYLCLRNIFEILTSPTLDRGQIQNLAELVKKHNKLYIELVGKLKPKMHFLLHYSRIMLINGPVIHYSAMKYERKNKQLKEIAVATTSNINLPLTTAIKHQLQLCYAIECSSPIESDVILGPIDKSEAYSDLKKVLPNLGNGIPVSTLKNINILGIMLSPGAVFITRISESGPHFAIIKKIFNCKQNVYVEAEELEAVCFDHHYYAYRVQYNLKPLNVLINVKSVPRTSPCLLIKKGTNEFVATRYEI